MSDHRSRHFSVNPDNDPDIRYNSRRHASNASSQYESASQDASGGIAGYDSSDEATLFYSGGFDDSDGERPLGRRKHLARTSDNVGDPGNDAFDDLDAFVTTRATSRRAQGRVETASSFEDSYASTYDDGPIFGAFDSLPASDDAIAMDVIAPEDLEDIDEQGDERASSEPRIPRRVKIALAAVVVLLLVLVPAVVLRQKEKKLEEALDARAQVVFEIVQKRLSDLAKDDATESSKDDAAAGEKVDGESGQQASVSTSQRLASFQQVVKNLRIVEAPSDYPGKWTEDIFLVALSKSDKPMTSYLFDGTSDIIKSGLGEGEWIVELNPETAEVYSAFWWNEDDEGTAKDLTYEELKDLRRRNRLTRNGVGYFNREEMTEQAKEVPLPLPTVDMQVMNREELYVSLTSEGFKELAKDGDEEAALKKTVVELTVSAIADENRTFTLKLTGDDFAGFDAEKGEIDVVLDSMRTDKDWHFAQLSADDDGNMTVIPGEDVSVSAKVTCEGYAETQGIATDAEGNAITEIGVNSLFANGTTLDGEVQIACLRHLNNLRNDWCADGDVAQSASFATVKLMNDIDFDGTRCASAELDALELPEGETGWLALDVSLDSRKKADEDLEQAINEGKRPSDALPNLNPLTTFDPIVAYAGFANDAQHVFDADGHVLRNFAIGPHTDEVTTTNPDEAGWLEGGSDDTGLFATAAFQMRGVRLENFIVNGGNNTGALVGSILEGDDRVMIEDCYLYGTTLVKGDRMVGGLVGKTEGRGSIRDCHIGITPEGAATEQMPAIVASGDSCGGVVGYFAGGVIGVVREDETSDISVLADVRSGTDENGNACLGGVAGAVMGETETSIASVDVGDEQHTLDIHTSGASVGGVVGYYEGEEIRDCIVTAIIEAGSDKDGESYAGGIAGRTEGENASFTLCRFGSEDAKVSVKGSGGSVGGIVGRVSTSGTSADLEVFADIEAGSDTDGLSCAGGIAGQVASGASQWARMETGSSKTVMSVKGTGSCVGGAFGFVEGTGEISDCTIYAVTEAGTDKDGGSFAGGLVGSKSGGSISNCMVGDSSEGIRMSVKGTGVCVGGLVGSLDKTVVKSCSVYADVAGGADSGGVVGNASGSVFEEVAIEGNVSTTGSFVGGFVGESGTSTYSMCYVGDSNNEDHGIYSVSGDDQGIGGFFGRSAGEDKFDNCVVVGTNIKGGEESEGVGGIGGFADPGTTVTNCSVQGYGDSDAEITGKTSVGAFCGAANKDIVDEESCEARVSINGKHWGDDEKEEPEEDPDDDDDIPTFDEDEDKPSDDEGGDGDDDTEDEGDKPEDNPEDGSEDSEAQLGAQQDVSEQTDSPQLESPAIEPQDLAA